MCIYIYIYIHIVEDREHVLICPYSSMDPTITILLLLLLDTKTFYLSDYYY